MSFVPLKKLNDGSSIPTVGLGTFKAEHPEDLENAIRAAVQSGYRHFDCAWFYKNEDLIGKTLRDIIDESNGQLTRADFFITSKCWNTFHSKSRVAVALDDTLKKLGMDYVDLYLIHWPTGWAEDKDPYLPLDERGKAYPSDVHYLETYQAMEELVAAGKTKRIGVSNFTVKQLQDVLDSCKIKPVCNQIEVNPTCRNEELVKFCLANDIVPVAYAPIGAPYRALNPMQANQPQVLQDERILALAKKYNKTPAQIILRWLVQRGIVVIPKSVSASRIAENIQLFDFELTDEDCAVFNTLPHYRHVKFDWSDEHPFYPFEKLTY